MDLNNMLNLLNNNQQNQTPPLQTAFNIPLYPELLDVEKKNEDNQTIHTASVQPQPQTQNTNNLGGGGLLPFNINPDMLKLIQQILPLLTKNEGGGTNILSSLLGGGGLGGLLSNKKNSASTLNTKVETESEQVSLDDYIRVDDY